jgi:hypothetical protein
MAKYFREIEASTTSKSSSKHSYYFMGSVASSLCPLYTSRAQFLPSFDDVPTLGNPSPAGFLS